MNNKFQLLTDYDALSKRNKLPSNIKDVITTNLNPKFNVRDYQKEAFIRLEEYIEHDCEKQKPIHLLLQMATGSGKTLVMAGSILYLYSLGYRNFLFFVNSTNVLEKTRDNFLNNNSLKYLFNQNIVINNKNINIIECDNFDGVNNDDISICFTTIQGLHSKLNAPGENALTYEDFNEKKRVLLSDEAHHLNVATKKKEAVLIEDENNWETTVVKILNSNEENIMIEFTATAELNNAEIANKYNNKLLYDYSLKQFYLDRYSKDVQILQYSLPAIERAMILPQLNRHTSMRLAVQILPELQDLKQNAA
jgi:type III restriction enzyme